MPGFWFTIESTSTKHLLSQFKSAIRAALATDIITRAEMRARSSVQRFPVKEWVEDLEKLQNTSINKHRKVAGKKELYHDAFGTASASITAATTAANSPAPSRHGSRAASPTGSRPGSPSSDGSPVETASTFGRAYGPGHDRTSGLRIRRSRSASPLVEPEIMQQPDGTREYNDFPMVDSLYTYDRPPNIAEYPRCPALDLDDPLLQRKLQRASNLNLSCTSLSVDGGNQEIGVASLNLNQPSTTRSPRIQHRPSPSLLSLREIIGSPTQENKEHFNLEHVDPFFQDSTELYYKTFDKMLNNMDASNSESKYCIEEYLNKSEKKWFQQYHNAKLGNRKSRPATPNSDITPFDDIARDANSNDEKRNMLVLLGNDYKPPTGCRKLLQYKIGDWPLYAFLLALGQILAANSYQITLIAGQNGQTATQLYVIASVYLASTMIWWCLFRRVASVYILSTPFFFYGLAFLLLGFAPFNKTLAGLVWTRNVATGLYAFASATGSLFFALNFGSEGMFIYPWWHWAHYLTASRWDFCQNMGFPSLHCSRHTTDLYQRSLVVGWEPIALNGLRGFSTRARLVNPSTHRHYNNCVCSPLGHRCFGIPGPARLLPVNAGCHSQLLLISLSPENYRLVSSSGDHPELLLVYTVRA